MNEYVLSRKLVVSYFLSGTNEFRVHQNERDWQESLAHRRRMEDGALSCFDCVGERCCVIQFFEANSWRDFNRL